MPTASMISAVFLCTSTHERTPDHSTALHMSVQCKTTGWLFAGTLVSEPDSLHVLWSPQVALVIMSRTAANLWTTVSKLC